MTYFNSPNAMGTFNYVPGKVRFSWWRQLKSYLMFKAYYFPLLQIS